jgi:hypothetical protein
MRKFSMIKGAENMSIVPAGWNFSQKNNTLSVSPY